MRIMISVLALVGVSALGGSIIFLESGPLSIEFSAASEDTEHSPHRGSLAC
ncbi:MAG: hypothetical protein IPG25_12905 [Proteobacteria bacterium]|nr:hypothetical protein [Pseudomonadota bacterium]